MQQTLISVDVEASGPVPGEYSMLSLGACVVNETDKSFYVELVPLSRRFEPVALQVAHLDLEALYATGVDPARAMADFEDWIHRVTPHDSRPIFVGYPLAFDWMFVAYYFHRFLGHNPFGINGLDIKSYYSGLYGLDIYPVGREAREFQRLPPLRLTHNAREDAIAQAELFKQLLAQRDER